MDKKGDNSFGVASVILGILSVALFPLMVLGALFGVIGLIFGIVQHKASKNKWSLWGIILSVLGIILSLLFLIAFISLIQDFREIFQQCLANPSLPRCEAFVNINTNPSAK